LIFKGAGRQSEVPRSLGVSYARSGDRGSVCAGTCSTRAGQTQQTQQAQARQPKLPRRRRHWRQQTTAALEIGVATMLFGTAARLSSLERRSVQVRGFGQVV
jgi:hypothetical protein